MPWIQLDQSLITHRKTIRASISLDIPEVVLVGHLAALWCWAMDNAHDGVLPDSSQVIARAARFEGVPDSFVNALIEAGFFDVVNDSIVIHDWMEYSGKLFAQRTAAAERMRSTRRQSRSRQPQPEPAQPPAVLYPDQPTPYHLWIAMIEETGADEEQATTDYKSRQLGAAKRLMQQGVTEDDVRGCIRYLRSQTWRTSPVDLLTVTKEVGPWRMSGRPVTEPTRASRSATNVIADLVAIRNGELQA